MRTARTSSGSTLVEILVSTSVMSIIALSFMAILLMNYKTNAKVTHVQGTVSAVRMIKERISRDVREGRSLGDVYGYDVIDPNTGMQFTQGSDQFPSTLDPVYGQNPPQAPNGWPGPPWKLSNTCLIVQVPICDNHLDQAGQHQLNSAASGWPTMIAQGQGTPAAACNQDNVETHVYMVLPDPERTGEWMMQYASFGGYPVPGYDPAVHTLGPQTLLTNITGPVDTSGTPKVFQFISKTSTTGTPQDTITPSGAYVANYTGVVCNLEVKHDDSLNSGSNTLSDAGFKIEVFLRNNALATSTGQPSNTAVSSSAP